MPELLISIHIPKTAGTTFGAVLKKRFGEKMLFVYGGKEKNSYVYSHDVAYIPEKIKNNQHVSMGEVIKYVQDNKIEAIHGHASMFEFLELEHVMPVKYVTFLRNPEKRAFSEYCHNRIWGNNKDPEEAVYARRPNSLFHYTGGLWDLFWYVGQTETFDQDIAKLGFEGVEKKNITPQHIFQPNEELINKYNKVDKYIYEQYLTKKQLN